MINLATILNTRVVNPNACRDQAGSKQSGEDVEKTECLFLVLSSRLLLSFSALGM